MDETLRTWLAASCVALKSVACPPKGANAARTSRVRIGLSPVLSTPIHRPNRKGPPGLSSPVAPRRVSVRHLVSWIPSKPSQSWLEDLPTSRTSAQRSPLSWIHQLAQFSKMTKLCFQLMPPGNSPISSSPSI